MSALTVLFAQLAAQAAPVPATPPDVEFRARVQAREVEIEQQGEARARVHAEPSGGERVEVERNLPKGRVRYRNLALTVQVDARIADALAADRVPAPAEDQSQQGTIDEAAP